jgi:small conductance mechanosensitive channel
MNHLFPFFLQAPPPPAPSTDWIAEFKSKGIDLVMEFVPHIIAAILVLIVGFWIISRLTNALSVALNRSKVDEDLKPFLISISGISLKLILIISACSVAGIETSIFATILGASVLAIGLSLQGSLSNFAGGILILLFKPFRKGDFITAQGHTGFVKEIQVFYTVLTTLDHRTIIIPNGILSNGSVENFTHENLRIVDLPYSIHREEDLRRAKPVLERVAAGCPQRLADKEVWSIVSAITGEYTTLQIRFWIKSEHYFDAAAYMHEHVKLAFTEENIQGPDPEVIIKARQTK